MHDKHPPEDLLHDEDVSHVATRAELLPTWFKISLTVLIFTHFRELWGIGRIYLYTDIIETDSMGNPIVTLVYAMYFLVSGLALIICVLYRFQWKHAITMGIPLLIISLLLSIFSLVGHFTNNMDRVAGVGNTMVNAAVLVIVIINSFRIRKQWSEAVVS
ncbi:hypothetical protein [Chitinophaga sp.]|uniref:hypothetical protein n=1 Tax=Chitinophaga sp. TaxID=1869181 RepID=UPI002FDD9CBB